MIEKTGDSILQEYEYLFGAAKAQSQNKRENAESFINDIRKDLSGEYNDNIDEKIQRWIDVTRIHMFFESRPVEFFIQTKMLYRDGFFEATIMMGRSVCEMVCYDPLDSVAHPFGNRQEVERVNFRRKLSRFCVSGDNQPFSFERTRLCLQLDPNCSMNY
jgi:hypothetical protein